MSRAYWMTAEDQVRIVKELLLERETLKKEIEAVRLELRERGFALRNLGDRLIGSHQHTVHFESQVIVLDEIGDPRQQQKFPFDVFDLVKLRSLHHQFQTQQARLDEVSASLRKLGFPD